MNYQEIRSKHPEMKDCFFAFNNEQLKKGIEKHNLKGKKLYNAGAGLIGTDEGIKKFLQAYERHG